MNLTGQELRDVEIREALRGYARDEVSVLLERAASAIEELEEELQTLQTRCAAHASGANGGAAKRNGSPSPVSVGDSARIGKTLLDAQTAADEAMTRAEARAKQLISDSEAEAEALVDDARSSARRVVESERRGIEAEICDLAERRDVLTSDADALERFGANFRERIRDTLVTDLERLDDSPTPESTG
jgi:cell division septum initiation protein DivIVA